MRRTLLTLLFLFVPYAIYGQLLDTKSRFGSPYSSIAFGEPADLLSPHTVGMGLSGVSVYDPYTTNNANPALWGVSAYSQGSIAFGLKNFEATDGLNNAVYNQFVFDQFQLVLPIVRSRVGLSVGFHPVTRSSYELTDFGSIQTEPNMDPIEFFNSISGTGGINKIELGLGYRFAQNFAVGYAGSIYLSSLNREHNTSFASESFSRVSYEENISGYTFGHRFGLFGRQSGLLRTSDELAFGAALVLPVNIDVDRNLTSFRDVGGRLRRVDLLPENSNRSGNLKLPLEFNLGLTYNPSRLLRFSVEYSEQLWGEAEYSLNPSQEQYLVNRSKIGIGTQFLPYLREGNIGFLSNFKYSAGVAYDTGNLKFDNNNIETLMFHTGLGILSQSTASSVDLSFQFGFRGTQNQNLVQETIWGFKLSLNLAEIMFVQPRFQ
jgi:hypothetical protein